MVSQTALVFNVPVGSAPQSQVENVTSSGAALSYSVTFSSVQNWVYADQSSGSTPGQFNVTVVPANLGVGTYNGSVTITPQGATNGPVVIPVTLNIGLPSSLAASPTSLSFTAQAGAASPAPQTLSITSASNAITFGATVSTTTGANWLSVAPNGGQTPTTLQVSINSVGLAVGTYNGTISVSGPGAGTLSIPVTLTVTGQPVLTISQSNIQFFYQLGQAQPAQQNLAISSGGVPVTFNASPNVTSCLGNWLVVNPPSGTTGAVPVNITVAANVAAFTQPVNCAGTITVTAPGATGSPQTVNVSLIVSFNPFLTANPSSVSFTYQSGAAAPAVQTVTLASSSTPLAYTVASSANWLTVGPLTGTTGTTSQLTLSASPTGLNPGTYNANVVVTATGAQNSPVTIPVTFTISANSLLTVSPQFANFNYQLGQLTPNPQTLSLGSTGAALPFTVAVPTTTGYQFITATPTAGTTPATLTLTANPGSLSPSVYSSTVVVTQTGSAAAPQNIPITLTVSNTPLANVSPSSLTFNYALNTAFPAAQTLAISSTSTAIPYTAASSAAWLVVSPANGTTPDNLTVGIAPYNLPIGSYTAAVMLTAGGQTQNIPVTLNITSGITLSAQPASLTFTQAVGTSAPAPLPVALQTAGGAGGTIAFSASASTLTGQAWLSVTPGAGTAPATLMISANAAGLSAGTYSGTITVIAVGSANANSSLTIPVTFNVTAAPALTVSPIGLNFMASAGGAAPAAQNLQVTSSGASPVQFTAAVTSGAWLRVGTTTLTTPATLPISVILTGLAQGTYNGVITLTPTGGGAAVTVPVVLTVSAAVTPAFTQLSNAASYLSGGVAPGEIVSLFGTGLGPVSPLSLTLTPAGTVSTNLGGVTVSFNGVLAPLTYVSALQINCVVPFEVAGSATAQVVIAYNGVSSVAQTVNVVAASPGLFTQNSGGSGLGSILKPDYSTVTASNPAPRGSTVIIYLTGGGQTTPASTTGAIAGSTLLTTNAPVTVTIGGVPATVAYAGSAPSLVTGVLQVNAVVPATAAAGNQPIVVTVGSAPSQSGALIALQ